MYGTSKAESISTILRHTRRRCSGCKNRRLGSRIPCSWSTGSPDEYDNVFFRPPQLEIVEYTPRPGKSRTVCDFGVYLESWDWEEWKSGPPHSYPNPQIDPKDAHNVQWIEVKVPVGENNETFRMKDKFSLY